MAGKRMKRWVKVLLIVVIVVSAGVIVLHWPVAPVKIKISRATTYVTGPLNADGTVNYVAALDAEYAQGATASNNAAVDLVKVFDQAVLLPKTRSETLRRLGLTEDDLRRSPHFVLWKNRKGRKVPSGVPRGPVLPYLPAMPRLRPGPSLMRRPGGAPGAAGGAASTRPASRSGFPAPAPNSLALPEIAPPMRPGGSLGPAAGAARKPEPTFTFPDGHKLPLDQAELSDVAYMLRLGKVHPDLKGWLKKNAAALDAIEHAVDTKSRFYFPLVSTSKPPTMEDIMLYPPLACYREAAHGLTLRAMLRARRGDVRGAWGDVLATHRLACLVDQLPSLVSGLVASGIDDIASKAGTFLATRGELNPHEAPKLLKDLQALPKFQGIANYVNHEDRFQMLDTIMMIYRDRAGYLWDIGSHSDLDWNAMLRYANAFFNQAVKTFPTPRNAAEGQAQNRFYQRENQLLAHVESKGLAKRMRQLTLGGRSCRAALSKEVVQCLLLPFMPNYSRARDLQNAAAMAREVETTAVAIEYFKMKKGHWPANLAELTPDLLKKVPRDTFSGGPLVYRPRANGYLLYSIGENRRDDGGVYDGNHKDDIAARVPPTKETTKVTLHCPAMVPAKDFWKIPRIPTCAIAPRVVDAGYGHGHRQGSQGDSGCRVGRDAERATGPQAARG